MAGTDWLVAGSNRPNSVKRRHLLVTMGATMGSMSLAGCEGAEDAVREFGPPPAAGFSADGVRMLGPPEFETTEYTVEERRTGNGEGVLVKEHSTLTTYGTAETVRYPFGVVVTPQSAVNGEATNPLVADGVDEFVSGDHGLEILDALGIEAGEVSIKSRTTGPEEVPMWREYPLEMRFLEAQTVDGPPTEVVFFVVNGSDLPSGLTVPSDDFEYSDIAVAFCSALQAEEEVPSWQLERLLELFDKGGPEIEFEPSWPNPDFDLSIEAPRLIQVVEDTRLVRVDENDDGILTVDQEVGASIPDPDLVEEENTAPMFDLGGDGDLPWYVRAKVASEGGWVGRENPEAIEGTTKVEYDLVDETEFDIRKDDISTIRSDSGEQAPWVLHDAAETETWDARVDGAGPWSLELPVFNLEPELSSLSIEFMTPAGQSIEETELEKGTDFETTGERAIRVGFIPVEDIANGGNYGGDRGFPTTYERTVDAAVEYLYRVFPGSVTAYRHDDTFQGVPGFTVVGEYVDFRTARRRLEKAAFGNLNSGNNVPNGGKIYSKGNASTDPITTIQNNGFDVWVMIVPQGYFDHHGWDASGLFPGKYSWAVGANEIRAQSSVVDAVGTVGQEIGHYFEQNPYDRPDGPEGPDTYPFAQRDTVNLDVTIDDPSVSIDGFDLDHARHHDSDEDGDGEIDEPGIISRGYDLTDYTYRSVGGFRFNNANFSVDPLEGGFFDTREMASYMSYAGTDTWADNKIYQDAIDTDYGRHNWGNPEPLFDGVGEIDEDGTVTMVGVDAYEGKPLLETWDDSPPEGANEIDVRLETPNDEVTASAAIRDTHNIGLHGHKESNIVDLLIEFPMNAATLRMIRGETETAINPITSVLRDVIGRIPENGFAGDAEEIRSQANGTIDEVAEQMASNRYTAAKSTLETEFLALAQEEVRAEYDNYTGQPTSEMVVDYTQRMIDRLDVLTDEYAGPQRLTCGASLPPNITDDTILQADCTYTVAEDGTQITDGVTLTIEPGVEIEVAADVTITVAEGGALTAQGTEDNPIEIRGSVSASGYWKGIEIQSDDPANELSHVTVAHAGDVYWNTAINVYQQATIRNCTVRDSSSAGIKARKFGTLVDFRDNHIENVEGPAMRLHPNQIRSLTGTTTFENIGEGNILVQPDMAYADERVVDDGTWPAMGLPYEFSQTTTIVSEIEIEAGATLQFQQGGPTRLYVSDGGQMVAKGTAERPITYRGVVEAPGFWGGIFIQTPTDNVLDNVVVRDAGGGYRDANVGVGIDGQGKLTISDSIIRDSAAWGIILSEGTLTTDNNTFSNNAAGDVLRPDE